MGFFDNRRAWLFRGKFLAGLKAAHEPEQLQWVGRLSPLADEASFAQWLTPLCERDWVVYSKAPLGRRPECVLKYLVQYTQRVAIRNHRLLSLEDGQVTFRYKDYAALAPRRTTRKPPFFALATGVGVAIMACGKPGVAGTPMGDPKKRFGSTRSYPACFAATVPG